ncbi:MAG: phosphopantothenoylcysteine decarboxylase/phosphopantothenate--cysteine ligase [Saprospiraceae bacterium]|jgi:phosphopantothenoylcysteine decarboxylase/phosphopantothenate--cysteine ligase
MLKGKKVLLGITASISAYKINYLVRHLVQAHAEVKVITTPAAKEFVSPLTLSTLSKHPVLSSFTNDATNDIWNNHVELGEWADLFIIAPASANTIAKMAHGLCDNLLLAVYLSARCPVWFAPAMDLDMYKHESTQSNITILSERGDRLIPPGKGELASGLSGEGRLEEPENIFDQTVCFFKKKKDLIGLKALVTAGPTYEFIDPVRFIGNPSSGKMGISIAEELARRGAEVTLVCGPSSESVIESSIKRIDVTSASEMFEASKAYAGVVDIACMTAAVADYTAKETHEHKVKKKDEELSIELKRTEDILKYFGFQKKSKQLLVGFAMETQNELENAQGKLSNKNADLIVLNSLKDKDAGFKHDTNKVIFVSNSAEPKAFELKSKRDIATDVVDEIIRLKRLKK